MAKQKYYRLTNILKKKATYNMLIGERSNGKSYALKEHCIKQAYEKDRWFIYLRRFDMEIKPSLVNTYFLDAPITAITNNEYTNIVAWSGNLYFANIGEDGKIIKGRQCGYTRALTGAQHYKSGAYDIVDNMVFEEFISDTYYIPNEVNNLMQLVSTVFRRRKGNVFLIGNTISRVCPYFSEWQLSKIPRQPQGTIDIYEHSTDQLDEDGNQVVVKIAVEVCENSGKNSSMFFGQLANSINGGAWQTKAMPHLPVHRKECDLMYEFFFEYMDFKFKIEVLEYKGNVMLHVHNWTTQFKDSQRVISNKTYHWNLATRGFTPLHPNESTVFQMIKTGTIYYADNLTGADFENSLLSFNKDR